MNDKVIEGIVSCGACGSVYRSSQAPAACRNCQGPLSEPYSPVDLTLTPRYVGVLSFLKPLGEDIETSLEKNNQLQAAGSADFVEQMEGPVTCGWCGTRHNQRPGSPNCPTCGGVLPLPPGSDPGSPPPAPPRQLPSGFRRRLYFKQNLSGWYGLLFMILSVPVMYFLLGNVWILAGLGFFSLGLLLAYSGFVTAYRTHRAMARGIPIPGRIESVVRIGPEKAAHHGSTNYRAFMRFDSGGEALLGIKTTYDAAITKHFPGEPIWIVSIPRKPQYHAIWPPLA